MDPIRTVIVDDVRMDIELLREVLRKECPHVQIVGEAQTLSEAETLIFKTRPQLVFLDISMDEEGATSFQMLDRIGKNNIFFEIVFYTAHGSKANQLTAIQFSDLDFIHKPVDAEMVNIAVAKASRRLSGGIYQQQIELLLELLQQVDRSNTRMVIERLGGQSIIIEVGNIVTLKANGPVTEFSLQNGETFFACRHLGYYERLLEEYYFFRIHHSLLVNLLFAKKLNHKDRTITLSTGLEVAASRHKWSDFMLFVKENKQKLPHFENSGWLDTIRSLLSK
jgi:two-component system, LytTR family, response regulator